VEVAGTYKKKKKTRKRRWRKNTRPIMEHP